MENKGRKSNIWAVGDEVLVEILCRLGGLKKAIQCKSVCKLWRSLVDSTDSSSYFSQRWRQINYGNNELSPVALITSYEQHRESMATLDHPNYRFESRYDIAPDKEKEEELKLKSLCLDFLPCGRSNKKLCILGCDKGLVLCCPDITDHSCYYVCNPLTKQWTALPPVPDPKQLIDNVRAKAGFLVHGDGQFTVVRMVPYRMSRPTNTRVFAFFSSDGGWRRIDDNEDNGSGGGVVGLRCYMERRMCKRIVAYGETLVCLIKPQWPEKHTENYTCFRFDPRDGQHSPLPLPQRGRSNTHMSAMGVSGGRLRFAEFVNDVQKLTVWQFEEDDGRQEWDKVQEWDLGEMELGWSDWQTMRPRCECGGGWMAVAFHPHDGDALYLLYLRRCRCQCEDKDCSFIFSCYLNEKTKKKLKKKRLTGVVIREIPLSRGESFKLFPLVPQCWPTPIPCNEKTHLQANSGH